jgi:hypothetical protein
MKFYIIQHIASGEFMPQMKRNRGYSHWNPSTLSIPDNAMKVPRLLTSISQAKRVISQWFANPNMTVSYYTGGDEDIKFKNDGRRKSDLRIRYFILRPITVALELTREVE